MVTFLKSRGRMPLCLYLKESLPNSKEQSFSLSFFFQKFYNCSLRGCMCMSFCVCAHHKMFSVFLNLSPLFLRQSPRAWSPNPHAPPPRVLGSQACSMINTWLFMWVLGAHTRVLMPAQQAHCQMSHLLTPSFSGLF